MRKTAPKIKCNYNKIVCNDLGCQLCWLKDMHDRSANNREECIIKNFTIKNKNDRKNR